MRMTTAKQYDSLNRLTSIASTDPVGNALKSHVYTYNSANQRTNALQADGSYWVYQYDSLGQAVSGKKYWSDGTPVAGQQFEYGFDDIGNRQVAREGGNEAGTNLRESVYVANSLNQYSLRSVPAAVEVLGTANASATVTANNKPASRTGDYFRKELGVDNRTAPVWLAVTNLAVLNNSPTVDIVSTNTGNAFVPRTPEIFGYDSDGNLTNDGRWVLSWDDFEGQTIVFPLGTIPFCLF